MVEASADLDQGLERFERLEEKVLQICGLLEPMPRSLSRWKTVGDFITCTLESLRGKENEGDKVPNVLISESLGMAVDGPTSNESHIYNISGKAVVSRNTSYTAV